MLAAFLVYLDHVLVRLVELGENSQLPQTLDRPVRVSQAVREQVCLEELVLANPMRKDHHRPEVPVGATLAQEP